MNKQMKQIIFQSCSIEPVLKDLCMDKKESSRYMDKYDNISITNIEYSESGKIKNIDSPRYNVDYIYGAKDNLRNIVYTIGNISRSEVYKNDILMSSIDKDIDTLEVIRVCEYELGKISYVNYKTGNKNIIYEYSYNDYGNKESLLKQIISEDGSTNTYLHNYEYDENHQCVKHCIYLNGDIKETRIIDYGDHSKRIIYMNNLN